MAETKNELMQIAEHLQALVKAGAGDEKTAQLASRAMSIANQYDKAIDLLKKEIEWCEENLDDGSDHE